MPVTLDPPAASAAADDIMPRHRFSASDVVRAVQAGLLDARGRYEVIEGDIVPMQAHNPPHMRIKRHILDSLFRQLDRSVWVDSECTLYLEEDGDYTLPDILVYPRALAAHEVRGPDVLLVVEVADSTFKKDRLKKATLYARFGVRDYWVVNALTMKAYVFRDPGAKGYGQEHEVAPEAALEAVLLPGVRVVAGEA
jgi:Uma2 family endonuclease